MKVIKVDQINRKKYDYNTIRVLWLAAFLTGTASISNHPIFVTKAKLKVQVKNLNLKISEPKVYAAITHIIKSMKKEFLIVI